MRRLLVMLALAGSSVHAAWARVAPVGPTRKPDSNALTDRGFRREMGRPSGKDNPGTEHH